MDGHTDNGKPIIEYTREHYDGDLKIVLGHSCDGWVIGSVEDAKAFIAQLQELITRVEQNPGEEWLCDD